ncbi:protein-L-isoaspartate O-methyltransferase [Phytophthora nicotianae P1569]|uniref:protein-L-isoaspartate(D-aspartate) O-methyltransferase n=1 Tax=Phytophthora nicotianae P1569 TaxID=1317065 RepID=V9F0X3_PHYNI|nr:protein-L-isoaspartate O-methyltransferase [Phytophthora nicotianae P1569]
MAPMLPLWPCSSTCNDGLVQNLQKVGIVRSAAVFDAMKRTDRALFVPRAVQDEAYQDSPCPIGFNQIISAPHMHAQVLELAHASCTDILKPRVLDVGAGSGYLTAALARLVEDAGCRVFGLELLPTLARSARKNVSNTAPNLLKTGVLSLHCYNGWYGLPAEAPFHFIFVGAAVSSPPQAMLDQLADGGQLVIPVDDPRGGQALVSVTRRGSCLLHRKLMPACFVPLVRGEIYKNRRGVTSTDSELQQ